MTPRIVLAINLVMMLAATVRAQEPAGPPLGNSRISGRVVTADTGAALASAGVSLEATRLPGASTTSLSRTTSSDANGSFDFSGLPAGDYRLSTTKAGYLVQQRFGRVNSLPVTVGERQSVGPVTIAMIRGGAITGRIFDAFGEPLAQAYVHAQRYAYSTDGRRVAYTEGVSDVTDDLGQFRIYGLRAGDFIVAAARNTPGNLPGIVNVNPAGAKAETSPTYYPGTVNLAEAQTVPLGSGQEASVQFMLAPGRLREITGTVIATAGLSPAGMQVRLRSNTGEAIAGRSPGMVWPDSTFTITSVAAGDYWVDINQPPDRDNVTAGGSARVSVSTEDVDGVTVVVTRGTTLQGDVVFEGVRPRGLFVVQATSDGTVGGSGSGLTGQAEVRADGRFEVTSLFGRVYFETVDEGWVVKSVLIDGAEFVDDPLDLVGQGAISGVRVTVTNRRTSIAGQVTDKGGRRLRDHLVILQRTDRASVRPALTLRTVRTDAEGRFETRGMRPGAYVIGVVDDLEAGYQWSPDFQERLRNNGRRFSLGDGESVVLGLEPTSGLQ